MGSIAPSTRLRASLRALGRRPRLLLGLAQLMNPLCCARRRQRRGRPVAGCSRDFRDHVDGAAGHQAAAARGRPAVVGTQPGRVRQPQLAREMWAGAAAGARAGQSGSEVSVAAPFASAQPASAVMPLSRRWLWMVTAVALALSFAASPGQISPTPSSTSPPTRCVSCPERPICGTANCRSDRRKIRPTATCSRTAHSSWPVTCWGCRAGSLSGCGGRCY